jgi:hypothetical protein
MLLPSQAIDWLLEHLRSSAPHPPEVVAMHEQRFVNSLELAVRFGKVGWAGAQWLSKSAADISVAAAIGLCPCGMHKWQAVGS